MNKIVSAAVAGLLFGTGIAISGMANPAKVLNFFDLFGTFDPSLIFVMGGALLVASIGYRLTFALRTEPLAEDRFHLPQSSAIDAKLLLGAATFGIGWGIAGFCPGGAIPVIGLLDKETLIFVAAMSVGIMVARFAATHIKGRNAKTAI